MTRFFVAVVKRPDLLDVMKRRGLKLLNSTMIDYAFLEDKPENHTLLQKGTELGVTFLYENEQYVSISEKEMNEMSDVLSDALTIGTKVLVTTGPYENLEGVIETINPDDTLQVKINGLTRSYPVKIRRSDAVPSPEETP